MNFYEFSKILQESRMQTIHSKDPVRNAVANIESYWPKPGTALSTIQSILMDHGYVIPVPSFNVHDKTQEYTQRFRVEKIIDPQNPNSETIDSGSVLVFGWHWMPSKNQVEVTAYLS